MRRLEDRGLTEASHLSGRVTREIKVPEETWGGDRLDQNWQML